MADVNISVLGVPELQKELKRLTEKAQKNAVRPAMRASAKRIKGYVIENLSNNKVDVQSGTLLRAFQETPIRAASRRNFIRVGLAYPEREYLGIAAGAKYYYPTAVEYGHKIAGSSERVPPHPYMRPAVDEHKTAEWAQIARDIGKGIEKQAGK